MNYYKAGGNFFMSTQEYDLEVVEKDEIKDAEKFYLLKDFGKDSRFIFDLDIKNIKKYAESTQLFFRTESPMITAINTSYDNWLFHLDRVLEDKWSVNIIALGDVGSTLLGGLKLKGGEIISEIGIYDLNENQLKRLEMEYNQVLDPFSDEVMPKIKIVEEEDLFDCDMLIFCASKAIPEVGSEVKDVRMVQFEANKKIVSHYAKLARENYFKGVFAVVSDPVDLLSRTAFNQSNTNDEGKFDYKGLKPEQVIGYGLGVMNARANYYAEKLGFDTYRSNGRAYGPHGKDLVIINDLEAYNRELSTKLTELAVTANKEVRAVGYKPFIAPALSSAALSIINTMKGNYNYSSVFVGGVYYGCKNRLVGRRIEIDQIDYSEEIYQLIETSYQKVNALYE
jgi:malate/lactate dehydrogenase